MLFNSIDFSLFLPIVFIIYWFFVNKNLKIQNLFLVITSYVFYGWWDWKFLILITITILCSWLSGLFIIYIRQKETREKNLRQKTKIITIINILINLCILGFFKYYNFFVGAFIDSFSLLGKEFNIHSLNIILPIGISFYTFQALSYTIDVYRKKVEPTKDIISFVAFISFFPLLVAGPIERATNFLPQFYTKRTFDYTKAVDGLRQILWGLFKKVVIADNCAICVNYIFPNYEMLPGSTLLLGAFFFSIQIYCDFSGYSDIAIGCARLFGFNAMQNFAFPYFSRDIAEFWRRWHISLTTWFRDYVYIPLGGSREGKWKTVQNTFIVYLVSGFWHGANWTFILWGLINAIYFLPLLLFGKNRKHIDVVASGKRLPSLKDFFQILLTFALAMFAWIFFRAETVPQAFSYIKHLFSKSLFVFPTNGFYVGNFIVFLIPILFIFEWIQREKQHGLDIANIKSRYLRWIIYSFILFLIGIFMQTTESPFIYFQF